MSIAYAVCMVLLLFNDLSKPIKIKLMQLQSDYILSKPCWDDNLFKTIINKFDV